MAQRREDRLSEAGLVADLGDQVRVVDEDVLLAGDVQAEDALREPLGQLAEESDRVGVGKWRCGVEDRNAPRGRGEAKVVRGVRGHDVLLCVEGMGKGALRWSVPRRTTETYAV
ncbi:hypothetical protein [Streptomyces sp. NPDC040750]|uniref:hypothetical protein n=1 Tax=Streptomyces sp. NPDC040750 TaxID=3154491 RepID=UPI0033BFD9F1